MRDAGLSALGAVSSMYFSSLTSISGWAGVGVNAAVSVGEWFVGRMVLGNEAGEEILKGGLTATIIRALHQAGMVQSIGLGLYAPSWFGVPTASSQYLQSAQANIGPYRRGAGTIFFPGPGGQLVAAPAAPGAAPPGMSFHRFRSRYAGNY